MTNVALAIVLFLLSAFVIILVKRDHDIRHVTERKRKMGKNNRYHKERGIRRIDYSIPITIVYLILNLLQMMGNIRMAPKDRKRYSAITI